MRNSPDTLDAVSNWWALIEIHSLAYSRTQTPPARAGSGYETSHLTALRPQSSLQTSLGTRLLTQLHGTSLTTEQSQHITRDGSNLVHEQVIDVLMSSS